jgi:Domain of unknown function (DUF4129)
VPFRIDRALCGVAIAALLMAAAPVRGFDVEPASPRRPTAAEIERALAIVKADRNLATESTIKTLRWTGTSMKRPGFPSWLKWIAGLFRWVDQSARVLVRCAVLILVGLLVVYVVRLVRTHGLPRASEPFAVPTHVRDLDIRPESLPNDVGAAARALWDRGEPRAALALLYRGLLSRLAYVHGIAIRDSSTEGDCLALAAGHLSPRPRDYSALLVGVWQRSVYGREEVRAATVYGLCNDFASMLDGSRRDAIASEGTA